MILVVLYGDVIRVTLECAGFFACGRPAIVEGGMTHILQYE